MRRTKFHTSNGLFKMVSSPKPPPPPDMKPMAEANMYAARLQYQAAQENRKMWERQYNQIRTDTGSWRKSGEWANQQMMQGIAQGGLRPVRWRQDAVAPQYQMQFSPPPQITPAERVPKDTTPIKPAPPMPSSIMAQFNKKETNQSHLTQQQKDRRDLSQFEYEEKWRTGK